MHTVSGIYLVVDQTYTGMFSKVSGTVRELIVENSYVENEMTTSHGTTGSVVGELSGTLDTVKSSAYVVLNGSEYAGGLVGKLAGTEGKITDQEIMLKEGIFLKKRLAEIFAKNTGKTLAQVEKDMDRDNWMSAEEAKSYGIIDEIIK